MSDWSASTKRKAELPADWPTIRKLILERDHQRCQALLDTGSQCPERATDCDHIGNPQDHDPSNLRALCTWHHDARTAKQGSEATARALAKLRHPGIKPIIKRGNG